MNKLGYREKSIVENANQTLLSISSIYFPEKSASLKFDLFYKIVKFFTFTQLFLIKNRAF